MVQIYIKYIDDNYYLLDLDPKENINFKLTAKDLNDITKVFSPFTQSFKLDATDKNKILCGFIGNEKIQRINNTAEFDAMIYISGFLFQSGKLSFDETDYDFKDQKQFKTNFASNLTSLTDKLGDSTIQDLFQREDGSFDSFVKIDWSVSNLKSRMSGVKASILSNGITFKYAIPFIPTNRVWNYDVDDLGIVDNVAYTPTANSYNRIELIEVRPAVNYMSIMEHLLLKIGVPINCPLFESPQLKELMVWCSSESLTVPSAKPYLLNNYGLFVYSRYDIKEQIEDAPSNPRWQVFDADSNGVIKLKRIGTSATYWKDGFDINLTFNNLISLDGNENKIKIVLKRQDGSQLDIQEIITNVYTFRVFDDGKNGNLLDSNGELFFKFEILPINLMKWDSIYLDVFQEYYHYRKGVVGSRVTRAKYLYSCLNISDSNTLGGNNLNLITALPKMKCVDFLKSFFKMFNISVISTGKNDQSMFWLTPDNIKEYNKPYSKRIVDYTQFTNIASVTKKKGNQYNQYVFSHKDSKYYDAVYGNGTKFGSLSYPDVAPSKPTKFEVKTDYSIMKQSDTPFGHPAPIKMCFGFSKDTPTVLPNGSNQYKPVYDEFTLFYLQNKSFNGFDIGIEKSETTNEALQGILEASFKSSNGKILSFGAENIETDSLYANYYDDFIELLLKPNTYKSEFTLTLPPNEIFLNFANLKAGESNIPTGFRPQNEIIIREQRYQLVDAMIELTTGKTKLSLLNF